MRIVLDRESSDISARVVLLALIFGITHAQVHARSILLHIIVFATQSVLPLLLRTLLPMCAHRAHRIVHSVPQLLFVLSVLAMHIFY